MINIEINTDRLTLREITELDTQFIVDLRNSYCHFNKNPNKITHEDHITWYREQYIKNKNRIDCVIYDSNNNKVGIVGVKKENDKIEVSYILNKKYQKKGYASEALNALIDYVKEKWNSKILIAVISINNRDSMIFAQKNGFIFEKDEGEFKRFKKEI